MDLRVGVLPTETTVEAGDTRGRLVAPALILEPLRGKIERPSAICVALSVRVYNHRYCPPCRSQKNMLFDQLAHANIAAAFDVPPRTTATMCFSSRRTDETKL